MAKPELKIVTRLQGNNRALIEGEVSLPDFTLDFVDVPVLVHAFRRMVRGLEFDVCEMALTTYLCAREHGVRFTALPIFLVRAFHHGAILHHAQSPVRTPKDLEGQAVGVNRGYTVTTGVWARAILQDEYDVDLQRITWMLSGDEHVESYRPPPNVRPINEGETIEDLLVSGKLAAAINIKGESPDICPLIPNPDVAAFEAFCNRGHYPINHLVVLRDDVIERYPDVPQQLFDAFAEAKAIYLDELGQGDIAEPDSTDALYAQLLDDGYDPLPYGIAPNRAVLEELIAHATKQQILRKPVSIESLFAESTRSLEA